MKTYFPKSNTIFPFLLILILSMGITVQSAAQTLDMEKFKGIEPRNIGPAGMSGRVTAIDAVVENPDIIYVGTASGGLWKSTSGGVNWEPLFENERVASIGAVDIYQKSPDVIWVGTGEGNPRNSMTNGAGIYRSLDGGASWELMGLEKTRNIHRVIIHPDNPDIVYVGAMGNPWDENEDRGVYKTTDGGKTWGKILYNNDRTGVGDMIMDPSNPNKLFVGMWEHHRDPWFFKSGGEGSGMYVTVDGGKNWTKKTVEDGIPKGELGRIGFGISRSNPEVVYALIESKENAIYRSDDGGQSWQRRAEDGFGGRPFYYADIRVDPQNENRIYSLFSRVSISEDGGKSFEQLIPYSGVHPDHHAWWIHPENPNLIYEGNDGGLFISRDRAENWRFVENIPVGQFYHINVDMEIPYNVYGGMQDNGSWQGPSAVWRSGGIRNSYWDEVLFGDGFDVAIDHSNSRYIYGMSQRGNVRRIDTKTGHTRNVRPVHPENKELRFNWNAAIETDPLDSKTLYFGTQYVHKSTDRGETWTIISPDLSTDDPDKQRQFASGGLTTDATGAENYTTVTAISASPVEEGIIWAGTDDGNVQVTRNGGESWNNTMGNMPDLPEGSWVNQVHASTYNEGEAFAVLNNYRQGDWKPMIYHTTDYGSSWENMVSEDDVWGYVLSFAQDPVESNLMFAGTEFGLYVSIDGGETWTKWTNDYPTVSTYDMIIHPRDHDLAIGTFGRGMYILDDIRPLRALAENSSDALEEPINAYPAPDAYLAEWRQAAGTRFDADGMFRGENRPSGALLTYSINKEALQNNTMEEENSDGEGEQADDNASEEDEIRVKVEVLNEQGDIIRTFYDEPEHDGMNRLTWNLREDGMRSPGSRKPRPNEAKPSGLDVLPGRYTVRFSVGDYVDTTSVQVHFDPRIEVSMSDLESRKEMLEKVMEITQKATEAVDHINQAEESVDLVLEQLEADSTNADMRKTLTEKSKAMKDSLESLTHLFLPDYNSAQGAPRDTAKNVRSELYEPSGYISSSFKAPGQTEQMLYDQAESQLRDALEKVNNFFEDEWPAYRREVENTDIGIFKDFEPVEIN